ncbi:MAG TPA: hypothetical protein VIX73_11030 [Kofleriaceae bacterium]
MKAEGERVVPESQKTAGKPSARRPTRPTETRQDIGRLDPTPTDLVEKIGSMLEYMMLGADPTLFEEPSNRGYPVPSGIPMGIVTLPDLVVDVAINGNKKTTASDRGQVGPLDVGGRAGRLTRVLQDFGGPRKGWYHIKYVAKAGDVGRVVLDRTFCAPMGRADFEPLSLRYIVSAPHSDDWLHVHGATHALESSPVGLAVTSKDVEESHYSVVDLLADARYIVISSKRQDHAVAAVELIADGFEKLTRRLGDTSGRKVPIGILLDLSALGKGAESQPIVRAFSILKEKARSTFDLECTALCVAANGFDRKPFDHILIRTGLELKVLDDSIKPSQVADSVEPVRREALTAGYVLASACSLGWRLLRQWYAYFPNLRPVSAEPHDGVPGMVDGTRSQSPAAPPAPSRLLPSLAANGDPIPVRDRIAFARQLALATRTKPITYGQLLESARADARSFGRGVPAPADRPRSDEAAHALVPRFRGDAHRGTLSLFLPPSELQPPTGPLHDTDSASEGRGESIEKAVMFDLDATLIDPEGMRRACWFSGLKVLFREAHIAVEHEYLQTAIELYETFVYKQSDEFRSLLRDNHDIPLEWQPCDFRQVWNHHYAWAALLWFLELRTNRASPRGPAQTWIPTTSSQTLQLHRATVSAGKATACGCPACLKSRGLFSANDKRDAVWRLRKILIRFRFAIEAAQRSFWEIDYPCYPQARSCVEMLRSIPGYEVYVVTEGHEETQVQKLKCSGLGDLFPRERVLSTGAASAAEEARNDLAKLQRVYQRAVKDFRQAQQSEEAAGNVLADLSKKYTAALESITFLTDLLSVLYSKSHKRFYSAVIIAICLNPRSPAPVLQSFSERRRHEIDTRGVRGTRPIQFFMVGDRYDNDCRPLLDLHLSNDGNIGVGTCRLLSGKRAKAYCPPDTSGDAPSTMLVCDTLAQVAHILHRPKVWQQIAVLKDVTRPVLLDQRNGSIMYGPDNAASGGMTGLAELAPKLKELCWARASDDLRRERVVEEMLDQIERDLAVSDPSNLTAFLDVVKNELARFWRTPHELEASLLKGGLRVLAGINSWRQSLKRPLPADKREPSETLAWLLGSYLLYFLHEPLLSTDLGVLNSADASETARTLFEDKKIGKKDVLDALPYSDAGVEIVQELEQQTNDPDFQTELRSWLALAGRVSNTGG